MTVPVEVLFVDDDPFNMLLAKRIFKKLNKQDAVQFVHNGEEALEWWRGAGRQLPALVLLDVNMPVLGGFEMLNRMLEEGAHFQHTNIILMISTAMEKRWTEEKSYHTISGTIERPLTEEAIQRLLH